MQLLWSPVEKHKWNHWVECCVWNLRQGFSKFFIKKQSDMYATETPGPQCILKKTPGSLDLVNVT